MPARKKEAHYYSVYLTSYASEEAKNRIEDTSSKHFHVSTEDFQSEEYYSGSSESTAMRAFFRASRDAMSKDLVISVRVVKDFKTVVEVKPKK